MSDPATAPAVTEHEHVWIPMPDGVRLAARLWLPAGSPAPALLEYIPYRKRDMVRARDERNHPVFAAAGFASLRVDMRGSGDSEGHMPDMYAAKELEDARHVIDWIAAQPWCSGAVGMFGTSWGGTASLQAAIDPPAALKAVIAVCATHDRYEDDIHHKGGCLLTDSVEWGATLPAILAAPPSEEVADWRSLWRERLEALTFPLEAWVREEERSAYWRHGSIIGQTARLGCPVLAIGGCSDRYSNSVMSLVEARPDLVWGIVGPWGHHYPDAAHPGPGIGFQAVALDWWRCWLGQGSPERGGAPDWPRLRLWLSEFDPPANVLDRRSGGWIAVDGRASAVTAPAVLHASDRGLSERPAGGTAVAAVPWDLRVGETAGDTGYFGRFGGLPLDQCPDDARSLTFDTEPLTEPLTLLGAAELDLEIAPDRPLAQMALRLCDVAADGVSARVALAVRNLALADDLATGQTLMPGAAVRVRVPFPTRAYRFAPGHRVRLALSASCWPMIWPPPEPVSLRLRLASCRLRLPALSSVRELAEPFPAPAHPIERFVRTAEGQLHRESKVEADGTRVAGWRQDQTGQRFAATGTAFAYRTEARHAIHPSDPLSAATRFCHTMRFERPDGVAEVTGIAALGADRGVFRPEGAVTVSWQGDEIFRRTWSPVLPRRLS